MKIKNQTGLEAIHIWENPNEIYLDRKKWVIEQDKSELDHVLIINKKRKMKK
jgi:hypothetical protein